jgi:Ecdysteroid kinase-like family
MRHHMSSMIANEDTPLSFFFMVSMQETLQTLRETPDLQQYVPLLENFDIVEREREVFKRKQDEEFHVLNHGDLWINNIFFSYNECDEPINAMLVRIVNHLFEQLIVIFSIQG